MKKSLLLSLSLLLVTLHAWSQTQRLNYANQIFDSSHPASAALKNNPPLPGTMGLTPTFQFDEFPINHNMHIAFDGAYYYTINGGNSGTGQINLFDAFGNLLQTFPIQIDGRGLSYNAADGFLYASLYARDIVKITNLSTGSYTTVFSAVMQNDQASFAISPDGTVFYDFYQGTLRIHEFVTGAVINTITGLSFGAGNYGGDAAVAVDSSYIYTYNSFIKTVYKYDLTGSFVQTMVLDSGDNGHSISVTNNYLFVSRDGNYAIGTWYGYPLANNIIANLACTDTSFCDTKCIDFFDLSTNNPTSWQWFFPGADSTSSTLQNPTNICYSSNGSFDVMLIACDSAGCDTLMLPGFINNNPLPVPVIAMFSDTLITSGYATYQWWSVTNGIIAGAVDSFFVPAQTGDYYVVVSNITGCSGSSNIISVTSFIPVSNILSSDTSFCEKLCIDFTDLSTNNPTSWQWFFPGSDSLTSLEQNPTGICYNNYGSFDITLIACNTAGCDTLFLPGFINEYATPVPTITKSNDTLFSSPGVSYQWWSVDSGLIAGATNNYFVPNFGSDYFVIVTDTIGCAGTSNVISVTGIAPLSLGDGLGVRIVPNPNNGSFSISLNPFNNKDFQLRIIDPIGRIVFQNNAAKNLSNGKTNIELGAVAKGLYTIVINNDSEIYRARFIIK